jgi:RND family efflux transporter MFP subunit
LAQIDERVEKMVVHAPFAGRISEKHTELGEWLSPGSPIVTLVQIDQIDAVLDVPEPLLANIGPGTEVTVEITALGESFTGEVYRVTPAGNLRTRTFPVLVRMNNSGDRIKPGMSVRAELPISERQPTLIVPRNAVQTTPEGYKVFVNRGGAALPVRVYIQFSTDEGFAVDAPLQPGEQVVIEGNERLRPGQPIRAMGGGPGPGSSPGPGGPPAERPADATADQNASPAAS